MTVNRSDFQRRFKSSPDAGDRFLGVDVDDGSPEPFVTDLAGLAAGLAPLVAANEVVAAQFVLLPLADRVDGEVPVWSDSEGRFVSGAAVGTSAGLLLEDGAFLLLEDGGRLLLEEESSSSGGGSGLLSGSGAPATSDGVDGDFYIDTDSWMVYGPKATTWPAGVSMIGPAGDDGAPGDPGPAGPANVANYLYLFDNFV